MNQRSVESSGKRDELIQSSGGSTSEEEEGYVLRLLLHPSYSSCNYLPVVRALF